MKNKILYILMILIVLQSSIAVADFYQPHHSESEHTQSVLLDKSLSQDELETHKTSLENMSHGCHHYCASHSVTFINFNNLINFNPDYFTNNLNNNYSKIYKSRSITPDLRPPIA